MPVFSACAKDEIPLAASKRVSQAAGLWRAEVPGLESGCARPDMGGFRVREGRGRRRGRSSMSIIDLRNVVVRNTLTLAIAQASAYLIPLVTMPYLARVLGLEQFGLLGVASNILGNLVTFTDWGFSLSATREVARNADDPAMLRRLFWDTMAARGLLGLASLMMVVAIMACMGLSSPLSWILLAGWLQVLGSVIWVGWFLQGIEAMGSMAVASLTGRLLTVPLIFLYVHGPADTMAAIAIGGIGGIVSGIVALKVAVRATPLTPVECTLSGAWRQLCGGWHIFVSRGAIMLYTQVNVIIVGAIAGPLQAGLLFGAEKLQNAGKSVVGPLSTAVYPRVNSLVAKRPARAVRLAKRILVIQGVMSFGLFVVMLVSAPYLTLLFLGADYEGATPAVRWLSGTVFLVGVNIVLGLHVMLPFGMQRSFMRITIGAGLFNVAAILPCSYYLGATGASISIVSTEFIIAAAMALAIWREGIFWRENGALTPSRDKLEPLQF